MSNTRMAILRRFERLVAEHDANWRNWYAGITNDPARRLRQQRAKQLVFETATSARSARKIEAVLLSYGCRGGTGGGLDDSRYVYVYHRGDRSW